MPGVALKTTLGWARRGSDPLTEGWTRIVAMHQSNCPPETRKYLEIVSKRLITLSLSLLFLNKIQIAHIGY